MENERDYEVGYRRPPQNKRFRKGRSGNPKGRPRGAKNLTTLLDQVLAEPVIVTEQGKRRRITKREAMLKQLANKAASGDAKAMQLLLAQLRAHEASSEVHVEDRGDEVAEQLVMLERLTVEERFEFRRLLAKAQGDSEPVAAEESAAIVAPTVSEESST